LLAWTYELLERAVSGDTVRHLNCSALRAGSVLMGLAMVEHTGFDPSFGGIAQCKGNRPESSESLALVADCEADTVQMRWCPDGRERWCLSRPSGGGTVSMKMEIGGRDRTGRIRRRTLLPCFFACCNFSTSVGKHLRGFYTLYLLLRTGFIHWCRCL
jgi:hypothetical protein